MTPTPEDVYRKSVEYLLAEDIPGWVGLWDEAGVMEFPFAPPGGPERLDGRAAVAAYMADYPRLLRPTAIEEVVHRTEDPEVIVVEMRARGQVVATGEPYEMSYVAVLTVRDGRFVHYRDYWNPLAAARILGWEL
ncbi:nuclear transport factor 2 family protein [Streptomyces spongiae]|uniref:Nuclear transport factor 2 family protein n=1 Tax=Streptomyces spongiae TaxID=565072 RepID=A0A5N8XJ44_9ACTN|nr:nuclear transport factor 2 family protein [Streptomyces spongiae]MPY59116.1 nuclear transport factor 2 family protein [Streptomyces spongiae]